MDKNRASLSINESNNSLYVASLYCNSPSVRGSTSKYAARLRPGDGDMSLQPMPQPFQEMSSSGGSASGLFNSTLVASETSSTRGQLHEQTLLEDQQRMEATNTLFLQFFDGFRKYRASDELFDLVKEYEEISCDHLSVMLGLRRKRPYVGPDEVVTIPSQLETLLRSERNSWRLARTLFEDRLRSKIIEENAPKAGSEVEAMVVDLPVAIIRMSDKEVIESLYDRETEVRQMQLVIDWLEQNEAEDLEEQEEGNKIQFYSEGPHYWENTLHLVKTAKSRMNTKTSDREFCSQMDPDAAFRSKRPLQDLDKEDETRMLKYLFRYIRAGQLNNGIDMAEKLGYHWLAGALRGWVLHHDPNVNSGRDEKMCRPEEGNSQRDLWKYVCLMSSKTSTVSTFEKAVFGSLCGDIGSVIPHCSRWSDKLWAYLKASVDVLIEQELQQSTARKPVSARGSGTISSGPRFSVELPDDYWENYKGLGDTFREVEAQLRGQNWLPEEKFHLQIQKNIIVDDVDAALETMIDWIRSSQNENALINAQMLRFFAHLVLFLKAIDLTASETRIEFFTTILEAYIGFLINVKQVGLIATYVANLPPQHQIVCYSKLLEDITDKNERKMCLKLAKEARLDVDSITKHVVETIRTQPDVKSNEETTLPSDLLTLGTLSAKTTLEDNRKIDALDWLFLNQIQYMELLKQGNALMRSFILCGKTEAAKQVFRKVPPDIIDGVYRVWKKKFGSNELSFELKNFAREHLCFKAYFHANEAFDDWVRFYHNARPVKPSKPVSSKFTDKVAYEHIKKQYDAELDQWGMVLAQQAKLTADKIYNVLLFPDGGWMRDQHDLPGNRTHIDEEETRVHQLEQMRGRIIPQLVFVLHSVLHSSNRLKECIQITDIIASEQYKLYEEFSMDQLQDLLKKIRETSIAVLNEATDALGYTGV